MSNSIKNTLLADSIRLSFGTHNVLNGAWLRSETGIVTGVLGRNGSGKSCMFRAIMGELKTQELFVRVNDEIVTGSMEMGNHITYLPQKHFLPPNMTLREVFRYFNTDFEELVNYFPKYLHYYEYDTPFKKFSGGEVRIAEIWLCLFSEAPFCILDEPFSYLSPLYVEIIQQLIQKQKDKKGIVISDHNYESLLEISDEVLLLNEGYVHLIKDRSDLRRYGYTRL